MTPPRFLADECCPTSIVAALRERGFDVRYVAEEVLGLSDVEVLSIATDQDRVLLTTDKDFGVLAVRLGHRVPGILLLRVRGLGTPGVAQSVAETIAETAERLGGNITTVTVDRLRQRPL